MINLEFRTGYEVKDLEDRPTDRLTKSPLFNEIRMGRRHSAEEYGVYYGLYRDRETGLPFFVEEEDVTRGWDARITVIGGTSKSRELIRKKIEGVLS